jgi:hypothetical protein
MSRRRAPVPAGHHRLAHLPRLPADLGRESREARFEVCLFFSSFQGVAVLWQRGRGGPGHSRWAQASRSWGGRRRSNRAAARRMFERERRTTSHSEGWGPASVSYLLAASPAATTVLNQRPMPLRTHGPSCGVRTVRSASAAAFTLASTRLQSVAQRGSGSPVVHSPVGGRGWAPADSARCVAPAACVH